MLDLLVLNEASLPFPCTSTCDDGLATFFAIVQRAQVRKLRFFHCNGESECEWTEFNYANGFEFGRWLNEIDHELRLTVKDVLANVNCPSVISLKLPNDFNPAGVLHVLADNNEVEALGLGYASLLGRHALSFTSAPHWMRSGISIVRQWDEDGVVKSLDLEVPNIYSMAGLEDALAQIVAEAQSQRAYFLTLNERDNLDFPHLLFCRSAIKNLQNTAQSPLDFKKLIDVLNRLNDSIEASNCLADLVENSGLDISGESDTTMASRKLMLQRQFNHPDLGPSRFELHVKNFIGGKRLHFLPDYNQNKLCVGYFGKHLPI